MLVSKVHNISSAHFRNFHTYIRVRLIAYFTRDLVEYGILKLFTGGIPDEIYFTRRKYLNGIVGCISEIVLAGELKLNFDPNTLGTAHNVETGLL